MNLRRTILFPLLVMSFIVCVALATTARRTIFDKWSTIFDEYGNLPWAEEKARLDNFAIQLLNDGQNSVGYILVFDETDGCPGEAAARGVRAKRYIVEKLGVPWNRVVWRQEGYANEIRTKLLIAPRDFLPNYPLLDSPALKRSGPPSRACRIKLKKIRNSRWQ